MLKLLESGKSTVPLRLVEGMRLSDYLKQLREAPYIKHTLSDDKYATGSRQNWKTQSGLKVGSGQTLDVYRQYHRCRVTQASAQENGESGRYTGKGVRTVCPIKIKPAGDDGITIEKKPPLPVNAIRLPQYLSTVYALVCARRPTRP
ncbi:hypothetical protein DMI69_17835 [Escherichia coli]|nr:hypothetical protein [Escherichia coli]